MQTIAHYKIETLIGEGAFAKVYRAVDTRLNRPVALKVLKGFWLDDPAALARFKQEAQTMARLDHPHIVTIFEVGEARGQVYLAQKLVEGESLAERLKRGPLSWAETLAVLRPIAGALDVAHAQGFIHRDLKPSNILLAKDGTPYLSDFGLVRAAEGSTQISSSTGGMIGTPAYMAPEQWRGEPATAQTDVYALACMTGEMVTGQLLFDGPTPPAIMTQHVMDGPRWPNPWPAAVPRPAHAALKRALARTPADRPASAGALLSQLAAPPQTPKVSETFGVSPTPGWLLPAIVVAALFLLALLAFVWFSRPDEESLLATVQSRLAATQTSEAGSQGIKDAAEQESVAAVAIVTDTVTATSAPTQAPTGTPSPTATGVDTVAPTPRPTRTSKPTFTPTGTPRPTRTRKPTNTPQPAATPEQAAVAVAQISESQAQRWWAASGHADGGEEPFVHWDNDNPPEVPPGCAKCHSQPGFLDFLGADGSQAGQVDSAAPVGTVLECDTCHNPKAEALNSVVMPSGLRIVGLGSEAVCAQCHQGRESTISVNARIQDNAAGKDDTVSPDLGFANVHYFAAAATLYGSQAQGGYEYPGHRYVGRFEHEANFDACTECHNSHSLVVNADTCAECHDGATENTLKNIRTSSVDYDGDGSTSEGIYYEMTGVQELLYQAIVDYSEQVVGQPIIYASNAYPYFFVDAGRRGEVGDSDLDWRYDRWTPRLLKAAYNYQVSVKDPGAFTHNAAYIMQLLYDSLTDLNDALDTPADLSHLQRSE